MTDIKSMSPEELNQKALAYFKKKGINPDQKPSNKRALTTALAKLESTSADSTTHSCNIEIAPFIVYLYLSCTYTSDAGNTWTFEGHGIGVGAVSFSGVGTIVYSDSSDLHSSTAFNIAYAGGKNIISWSSLYQTGAAAASGGVGFGTFQGTGNWDD